MTVLELEKRWQGDGNDTPSCPAVDGPPVPLDSGGRGRSGAFDTVSSPTDLAVHPLSEADQLQIVPPPNPHKDAVLQRQA